MRGKGKAFLRTTEYLSKWKLPLKNSINTVVFSYNTYGRSSAALRNFVKYKLCQLQYNNPKVQMLTFKNHTPVPSIKIFQDDGRKLLIDTENVTLQKLVEDLEYVAGKDSKTLQLEEQARASEYNRANFGDARRGRLCMCEVPGQVPCPAKVPLPADMRKKPWMEKNV